MAHRIGEQCNGCGMCTRLCPVSAVSGEIKSMHVINERRCVDCGVCGRACNQGAVFDAQGRAVAKVPRKQWKVPMFDHTVCSACAICVDACGKNALAISKPIYKGDLKVFAMLIEAKACVGCGVCASECPMDAIKMEAPA